MTDKGSEFFDASSFFDRYADALVYCNAEQEPRDWDVCFIKFIKENLSGNTLLDVGAGIGFFAGLVKQNIVDLQVTALDPSERLLSKIEDPSIKKVVGKIPDLNLGPDEKFFFIHARNVLHHLVGRTVNESRDIVKESFLVLRDHLDDSGFLMILDEHWEGHVIPTSSRTVVFFLLSVARRLNIRVPHRLHLKGLIVCFYTISELENMFKDCGFEILQFRDFPLPNNRLKKFLFLKRWGRMLFIVRKASDQPIS
jgi:SAM-dependent methyltransferase